MTTEITSMFSSSNSIEYLVEQYLRLESGPRDNLVKQQNDLYERKDVLSDLDSSLSSLQSISERLIDPITDHFATKSASSSDSEKVSVSAGSTAEMGNHSITVERLAISDTRVSRQFDDSGSSFSSYTTDQTISIEIAHPTEADANKRLAIDVTIDAASFAQDDRDVLIQIADDINSAMYTAIGAETIDANEAVNVSVVTEESGKSRLVFRTQNSGYTYRMDFTDSADSLLADLEVNAAVQSTGTAGGYITDVGTSATDSELNAKFVIDGLTFYRDANNVTNALSGVTLKLLDTFTSPQTVTVTIDTDTVRSEVESFLDKYNDAIDYLRENTQMDPDTYERGLLADDITYRGIHYDLREIMMSTISGVSNSEYSKLFNIGIETDDDGRLSITDSEKFTEALESNSSFVAEIFNASDGIANQVNDYLENYVKVAGTIDGSKNNIDDQLSYLDDRIDLMDELLTRRENQLREEFTQLQEMMYQLSNQQSFFSSFFGS